MDAEGREVASTDALTHPKYRADIDGLRAVAVLSVLGFHAYPEWVRGGFIGVDIFFVISGFLISTIIFQGLATSQFSFRDFYSRRIRRIFPALTTVLLFALVAGWFVLYPDEYRQLGKHVIGGAGFISNFVLWRESGYFDSAAETKPLLHLWSLAIEEQYYIVFPLLVWLAWKRRFNLFTVIVLIAAFSYVLNIAYIRKDAVWTFYQPQTRIWELMIGALLALLVIDHSGRAKRVQASVAGFLTKVIYRDGVQVQPAAVLSNVKAWLGAFFLVVAMSRITRESHFPGSWALAPTLGAALLIWAGPHAWLNRLALANPLMVWVGKISYPLYLWHWVILVYLRILASETPSVAVRTGGLLAAVVLSWLTYRFIETPLRFGAHARRKTVGLLVLMLAIAGFSLANYKANGFPTLRYLQTRETSAKEIEKLDAAKGQALTDTAVSGGKCFQLPPGKDFNFFVSHGCLPTAQTPQTSAPVLMLIGDSHSASLSLGLRPWAAHKGYTFYQVSSGSCSLFSDDASDPDCQTYSKKSFEAVPAVKPDVLLIDSHWLHASEPVFFKNQGNWPSYSEYLADKFKYIASLQAKKVIIVGQVPTWKADLPNVLIRRFISRGFEVPERTTLELDPLSLEMDKTLQKIQLSPDFKYVSLVNLLCDSNGCLTRVGPDLQTDLIVWDYGHLTAAGAAFVVDRALAPVVESLVRH
jgi:peptidoglycan/LPS O-acetylase OafA/YrhL